MSRWAWAVEDFTVAVGGVDDGVDGCVVCDFLGLGLEIGFWGGEVGVM